MGSDTLGDDEAGDQGRALRVRAFFGLPLPEEHRAALGSYLLGRYATLPKFRWTRQENLHITLKFLGHVERDLAERIAGHVEAASPRGFVLQLGGLDSFKRGKLARVLWLGLKLGGDDVKALAALIDEQSALEGLEAEKRPYHPHLTLARSRRLEGAPVPGVFSPDLPPWKADELLLYRSQLGRSGPVYEPLRTIRLR